MYLRSNPQTTLGQPAPQVFQCTVDAIILDNFLVGDYRLRPAHYEKLMAVREFAKAVANAGQQPSVSLEGFTDNTGKEIMNRGLSVSRAGEVQSFFERVGVKVREAAGAGASSPRASNATEAGRRKNRRVEIRFCVLVPPSPSGVYHIKLADLMRTSGFRPAPALAGPPTFSGFADDPPRLRRRAGAAFSPTPALTFLRLDQFAVGKSNLPPQMKSLVARLADVVRNSWKSGKPIGFVRLTGHTDSTGPDNLNLRLGNDRAEAVKRELEQRLAPDLASRRLPVAILLVPSPGKGDPVADNRVPSGRARNRRVDVAFEPPQAPVTMPQQQVPGFDPFPPGLEDMVRKWDEEHKFFQRAIPGLPAGKSPKAAIDDWLKSHGISRSIRQRIWDAVIKEDWGVLSRSLDLAGVGGAEKNALMKIIGAILESPATMH